jgi:hypothetical protein
VSRRISQFSALNGKIKLNLLTRLKRTNKFIYSSRERAFEKKLLCARFERLNFASSQIQMTVKQISENFIDTHIHDFSE